MRRPRCWRGELADRADALAAAPDEAIALKANGRIVWAGSEIARLERGETALKPRIQLFADEHLAAADRERVQKRLEAWLEAELGGQAQAAHRARAKPPTCRALPAGSLIN